MIPKLNEINGIEDYLENRLRNKQRVQIKKNALKHQDLFKVHYQGFTKEDIIRFYEYYQNVNAGSFELSTFDLPFKLFERALEHPKWEFFAVEYLPENRFVSMVLSYKTDKDYCPVVFGMDKEVDPELNVYKFTLYTALERGIELGAETMFLGVSSNETKHKYGAELIPQLGFVQVKDHFNMDYINSLKFSHPAGVMH